jgi:hypothetical protein
MTMEKQTENGNGNGSIDDSGGKGVMDTRARNMTKKDFNSLLDFIGREDIVESEDILVVGRDDESKETEVVVLFKDELFARCKRKEEAVIHNENLGIDCDFRFNWDSAMSIRREDISCISVFRPPLCDCPSCSKKRDSGDEPEQAKYYLLEIMTPAKDYTIRIPKKQKQHAFELQDYIRQWRFRSGEFAPRLKRKKKRNGRR